MSVLFDYFSADSDETAAEVIDRLGGPGVTGSPTQPPKQRWFGRPKAPPQREDTPSFDTVSLKGIDPVVQMGTLEELLTGTPYEEVIKDPRSGNVLAERDGGERLVVTLTEALQSALAGLGDDHVKGVAEKWGQTDEFQLGAPWQAEDIEQPLRELAALAQRSARAGRRLYCWVCV